MLQDPLVWGYDRDNGPDSWHKLFPIANGRRQSPIDIKLWNAKFDSSLRPLNFNYDSSTAQGIVNKGYSFNVEFDDSSDKSVLSGGPLTERYRLAHFSFHWGCRDDQGSEHSIDDLKYAAELHLVHWNTKYNSFCDAIHHSDGLAIVGVFLKIGNSEPELQEVIDALDAIKQRNMHAVFTDFNPVCLLPDNLDFWTYAGSLTIPPLLECVIWIVLREPINISKEQLSKFRSLYSTSKGEHPQRHMVANWRPRQPLQGRQVRRFLK
ncbi:carbonic anhydrase 2-like [Antechinus flavipes]|uniref:carbonic anhydrase 2-like n=1 Tax=Antechinus flavipes TaxID=38775 RepID=UPI0022365E47|nr:carbonic anhydrase 2-like [Antechinus flavipes]